VSKKLLGTKKRSMLHESWFDSTPFSGKNKSDTADHSSLRKLFAKLDGRDAHLGLELPRKMTVVVKTAL